MQFPAGDNKYLVTEVFTAPPQKLQLMLIEAAIRLIGRARRHWQAREMGQACQSLLHAQEIVEQLAAGMKRDVNPELVDRVAAIYRFVVERIRDANTHRDETRLQDVLRILEIERETWRQVCDNLRGQGQGEDQLVARRENEGPIGPSAPHLRGLDVAGDLPVGGFSIEA
jgi:flagellar biosynthetic protein FliS